jgi:replicative DNA helicase
MHKDTKFDYEHFLNNLDVKTYDITSEYKLGRALLCGKSQQIMDILSELEPHDFYDKYIQVIYNTVKEEFERGNNMEGISHYGYIINTYRDRFDNVAINIGNNNEIGQVWDFGNVKRLPDEEETKVCIRMVKNKKAMRDMIHELFLAVDMCRHIDGGVEEAYDFLRANIAKHDSMLKDNGEVPKLDFVEGMLNHVMECNDPIARQQNTINMPWRKFQKAVGGFRAEQLVIISAKSGQGKSAFALNVGIEAGVTQKIPTLYINSELCNDDMLERYLSYTCYVDSKKIREGGYRDERTETKLHALFEKAINRERDKFYKGALSFVTIPDLQINNIERAIHKDCMERGTRMVIVDYIGRMDITKTAGVKDLQEWQIMRLAANRLKTLAQKYHVCVIMVCQLTDEGSLQGSKAMKNEADMWLSINRLREPDDSYKGKRLAEIFPYNTFVNIEKARGVADTGAMAFRYEGAMMRFCDTPQAVMDMIKANDEYGEGYSNAILDKRELEGLQEMIDFQMKGN